MDRALLNSLLMGTGRAPIPRTDIQRPVLQAFGPAGAYLPSGARLRPDDPSKLAMARAAASALGMREPTTTMPRIDPMLARVQRGEFMPAAQRLAMQRTGLAGGTGAPAVGDGVSEEPTSFGEAMRSPLTSPIGRAITGASLAGLAAGGWSPTPVTLGQGIASMGAAAQEGYDKAVAAEIAAEERDLSKKYTEAKIAEMATPKKTALVQNLIAAGLKPGTKAFQDALLKAATKPQTVFMGGDEQKKEAYKAAIATRKDMIKQVNADRELGVRLDTAINLLESGVETGRLQAAMLPLKQIAREVGALSDEDVADLSNQEIIDSITAYLTPRMRVTGSGASSDRDMDFFQRSTVRMANTPEANLVIAKMQRQVMDYNRRRLDLFDDFVKEKGDDFGFGRYADEKMGGVYQKANTDEELDKMISDGRLREGDVFFNGITGEFDILTKDMM